MKLFVLVHVFKLFTDEFFQIPMEKTNEKITSGTKATEDVVTVTACCKDN